MKHGIIYPILLACMLTACVVNVGIHGNPDGVANAAAEIADFDLPAGYSPEFSVSLEGYSLVSYNAGDAHSHLYLIQSDEEADGEKLASMVKQMAPEAYDPKTRMTIIDSSPVVIRDQEGTVVTSEGVTSDGETYRQMMVAFPGKGGPALLVLSESISTWNLDNAQSLVKSIR